MSTVAMASYPVRDSWTMIWRQLKHMQRYLNLTIQLALIPILFMLLFVYVFGDTLGKGLGGGSGGREVYVNYVVPGILMMMVTAGNTGTAVSVTMDKMEGIVARFKTMAIARVSVLTGHVVGGMIQVVLGLVLVTGVALLIGFRPNATPVEWLAAFGVLVMISFALTWLCVALGMFAKSVETSSNYPQPLIFLPFLGSGFVPTDSMPSWLRAFADHQPFTPFMETIRGLLLGTGIGSSAILSVAWSTAIALGGYLWAKKLFNRQA